MLLRDELLFAFFIRRSINRNVSPNFVIYFVFQDTRNREVLDIPRNNFKKNQNLLLPKCPQQSPWQGRNSKENSYAN
jgi:hypothetical protein